MFISMLTVLFIGLKLCGVIMWPWLWVLSPMWIPIFLLSAFLTLGFALDILGDRL